MKKGILLAVIVGLSGDPEHAELFRRWATTLVEGAITRFAVPPQNVVYLSEDPARDAPRATGKSTREEIDRGLGTLAKNAGPDDVVFVVVIGHGGFDGKVAKINLPGPDMAPADFLPLLKRFTSQHVVFVNTTSSSGPFASELAAPNRTIVTATRSGAEKYAPLFGGPFIDALVGDAADADRNKRVTVLEAFEAAKREVARAYEQQGLMLTEHPLLEDHGASVLSLGTPASAEQAPDDPKLRALYDERRQLEQRVEALKLRKSDMDPARYATEIEKLLIDLALKSRQIKEAGGQP